MQRFVGVIWNYADPHATRTANRIAERVRASDAAWQTAVSRQGLIVLHAGERAPQSLVYSLSHANGVVIGKLFQQHVDSGTARAVTSLESAETERIVASRGRHLVDAYWGRYVAFIRTADSAGCCLIRDPSGQFKCFVWASEGVHVAFSRMQDIVNAHVLRPSINWNFVTAQFTEAELSNGETGIDGIREVLAGECYEIRDGAYRRGFYWNPATICNTDVLEKPVEAKTALRKTTIACVGAWADTHESIAHEVSGGLDSSVVLACYLRASPRTRITCLNYFTDDPAGDERDYARHMARECGYELVELPMPTNVDLNDYIPLVESTPRPDWTIVGLPMFSREEALARSHGATAITSGQGGDHLFYNIPLAVIAADHAWTHGVSTELAAVALNVARLTSLSVWSVLKSALWYGACRRPYPIAKYDILPGASLLSVDRCPQLRTSALLHPWELAMEGVMPGKAVQIQAIARLLHREHSSNAYRHVDVIDPLISQPLMETCLRIPSYTLTLGGLATRALLRDAFQDDLPAEILSRESKGFTNRYFASLYKDNAHLIRELILGGYLAHESRFNRGNLENLLTTAEATSMEQLAVILQLLATELWLRRTFRLTDSLAA